MENKHVGFILVGISLVMIGIIFMFQSALTSFVDASCSLAHGADSCPMYDTISQQTYLALSIVGILLLTAFVLIIAKPSERVIIKKVPEKVKKKEMNLTGLTSEEKNVLRLIVEKGTIFQAELIEQTNIHKAKMTRILDRLEGRGLVERKRRGMTNVIVIKE